MVVVRAETKSSPRFQNAGSVIELPAFTCLKMLTLISNSKTLVVRNKYVH